MNVITGPTVRKFVSRLRNVNQKYEERQEAHKLLEKQLKKVRRLSNKKSIKKETLDNEFDILMNKFQDVLHRESKIIRNQRIEMEGTRNQTTNIMDEIKLFEAKFAEAMFKENDLVESLKYKITELENKIASKGDLYQNVGGLKDSLYKISTKLDESKNRDNKLQELEEKIKNKVYQDSIRLQKIEDMIRLSEKKYNELSIAGSESPQKMERLKERIDTLKDKHEILKEQLPKPNRTLPGPAPQLVAQDHLLFESKPPSFENILKQSKLPVSPDRELFSDKRFVPNKKFERIPSVLQQETGVPLPPPPPPMPKFNRRSMWQRMKGMVGL